jgi:hypothetical protein
MSAPSDSGIVAAHGGVPELGDALRTLIHEVETPLLAATLISRFPPECTGRASFRLQFRGPRLLKGLQCETPAAATRIETLLALFPAEHFPKVIARRGEALLLEWKPGIARGRRHCGKALLWECGQLQAAIHRLPIPAHAPVPLSRRSAAWEPWLEDHCRQLVAAQALSTDEGHVAMHLAQRHAPADVHRAVGHGDLCCENIVSDAPGRFYVIDNETVAVDACEYDLARTWYRWPMTIWQRAAYRDGYGQRPALWSFDAHLLHFAIVVLAESAAYRQRVHPASAHVPLGRLRALLARPSAQGRD